MTSEMSFISSLRAFLRVRGFIYTVRKYLYTSPGGFTEVEGVGRCKRTFVTQLKSTTELVLYVPFSGFEDIVSWQVAIGKFIKTGEAMYLYKVEVLNER